MNISPDLKPIIIVIDDAGGFKAFSPKMEELPFIESIDIHSAPGKDVNKVTIVAVAIIKTLGSL